VEGVHAEGAFGFAFDVVRDAEHHRRFADGDAEPFFDSDAFAVTVADRRAHDVAAAAFGVAQAVADQEAATVALADAQSERVAVFDLMRARGRREGNGNAAAAVAVALIATVFTLAVGFWIKDRCTTHDWNGYQYRTSCYNDIYALFYSRGIGPHDVNRDGVNVRVPGNFPYVHGNGNLDDTPQDGDLEYPVGSGYFIGGAAKAAGDSGQGFFRINALGLAIAGILAVLLVTLMASDRRRALYFALAPSLALYAFHNWDLLAVVLMAAGLYAFWRKRDGVSGAFLGAGAATKLAPGLIVPALALARWRTDRRAAVRLVVWSAVLFAAFNVPMMIVNIRGWSMPWTFQSERFPNFETHWYMVFRHLGRFGSQSFWFGGSYGKLTSALSLVFFLVFGSMLLRAESKREVVRPYATSFGLLIIFLLTNKVFSPQYVLWLLPFFVLVKIPWYGFAAFTVTEAAVWFGISAYFLAHDRANADHVFDVVEGLVYLRYVVLGWLLWLSRRAPENVRALELARVDDLVVGVEAEHA
jgi:hypothetical protein